MDIALHRIGSGLLRAVIEERRTRAAERYEKTAS
jgi:hypothetical protein